VLNLILHYSPGFATSAKISHQFGHFSLYAYHQIVRYKGVHLKLDVRTIFAIRWT